jgi:Ca2+-binding EF-hand superfamily protein
MKLVGIIHVHYGYALANPGAYLPTSSDIRVDIFACERNMTDRSKNPCPGFDLDPLSHEPTAHECSAEYSDFVCAHCADDGWIKMEGICKFCDGVNWISFIGSNVIAFMIALFLLHKSTTSVISEEELEHVWYKVDLDDDGLLDPAGVKRVMQLLEGDSVSDKNVDTLIDATGTDNKGNVSVTSFVNIYSAKAPTQTMPILLFFVQTTGLVLKDSSYFGLLKVFDLDLASASGSCILPLSTIDTFYYTLTQPITMCILSIVAVPFWNRLRKVQRLQPIWDKLQAPDHIESWHFKKAMLNVYLFCYQPITQACIQMLICRSMSEEGSCAASDAACRSVLVLDWSVLCDDGSDYLRVRAVAISILCLFVLVVPIFLLQICATIVTQRDIDMKLRLKDMNTTFNTMDVDGSGTLDLSEIRQLLSSLKMTQTSIAGFHTQVTNMQKQRAKRASSLDSTSYKTAAERHLASTVEATAGNASKGASSWAKLKKRRSSTQEGQPSRWATLKVWTAERVRLQKTQVAPTVSKEEFQAWYLDKVESVAHSPFDILFGTTKVHAYYWFVWPQVRKTPSWPRSWANFSLF